MRATVTVTLALTITPLPLVTEQIWVGLAGSVLAVTAKAVPDDSMPGNVTDPLPEIGSGVPPLRLRAKPLPANPETKTPTE